MAEKICGDCVLFSVDSITDGDIQTYAALAKTAFGPQKERQMTEYLKDIQKVGGGKRLCSAPRPFAYPWDNCDAPKEFVRLL